MQIKCDNCGTLNPKGANYCSFCFKKLEKGRKKKKKEAEAPQEVIVRETDDRTPFFAAFDLGNNGFDTPETSETSESAVSDESAVQDSVNINSDACESVPNSGFSGLSGLSGFSGSSDSSGFEVDIENTVSGFATKKTDTVEVKPVREIEPVPCARDVTDADTSDAHASGESATDETPVEVSAPDTVNEPDVTVPDDKDKPDETEERIKTAESAAPAEQTMPAVPKVPTAKAEITDTPQSPSSEEKKEERVPKARSRAVVKTKNTAPVAPVAPVQPVQTREGQNVPSSETVSTSVKEPVPPVDIKISDNTPGDVNGFTGSETKTEVKSKSRKGRKADSKGEKETGKTGTPHHTPVFNQATNYSSVKQYQVQQKRSGFSMELKPETPDTLVCVGTTDFTVKRKLIDGVAAPDGHDPEKKTNYLKKNGYDGYYDDCLPADYGSDEKVSLGGIDMDKVKKVAPIIAIAVIGIIISILVVILS